MLTKIRITFICIILAAYSLPSNGQTVQDTLKFAFFSDIHFGKTDYNGEPLYPAEWLKKALNGITRRQADLILVGGDLIESSGNLSQFDQFDAAMVTNIPWYPMPGNHDIGTDPAGVTTDRITKWLSNGYGRGPNNREFYGFVYKNLAAFYVLNTQAYISTDPVVKARSEMQLAELDSFFTANKDIPVKIISSHVPLFLNTQNEDTTYFNIGPTYRSKILALMNKHNVKYYVAGHQHINGSALDKGITVFFNTALSFQLGSGNTRGYYVYTVTNNTFERSFYPLSTENFYELKTKTSSYGNISVSPAGPFYDSASVVKLTAIPNNGWKFLRWSGNLNSTNNPDSIIMDSDKTIEAVYGETNPTYKIINSKSGMGQIVLDPPGGIYNENTIVTLSAQAETGWEFLEWTGDKNGNVKSDTLLMKCDREIKAIFKKKDEALISLKVAEDSYVRGGLMYSGKNMNIETCLRVLEGSSDSYRCRSFLKFNLIGIKSDVASAVLKMKVKKGGLPDGPQAKVYAFSVANDSWKESIITWKNAPQAETLLDSCVAINQEEMLYSWDLTEKVKQKLATGDTLLSIMIMDKAGINRTVDLYTKESLNSPELFIIPNKTVGINPEAIQLPKKFMLEQNYPNPFNPATEIKYSIPKTGYVHIKIYDLMGKEIAVLAEGFQTAGVYKYVWTAIDKAGRILPSGIYICSMVTDDNSSSIKMNLLK